MKAILLIPIISINFLFGQEIVSTSNGRHVKLNPNKTWEFIDKPIILDKSELKFNDKGFAQLTKTISLKNGKNENSNVELEVWVLEKYVDKIDFSKIENMTETTLLAGKYSLKNKYTFNPISLKITYIKDEGMLYWLEYTGQNDYGATKDSSKLVYFNGDGTKIKEL